MAAQVVRVAERRMARRIAGRRSPSLRLRWADLSLVSTVLRLLGLSWCYIYEKGTSSALEFGFVRDALV